ncbi:MAG: sugar phosphate nucleotidyltransferase [Bdellovibrio sp.]
MNVMLLAAGEGTRLRPYTSILPKPAIPFLTVPLACHALSFLNGSNEHQINKLIVNTFHLPKKIHELFENLPHGAQQLIFSDETGEILGGGGGLSKARQHFIGGGDFVMMNADEVILPQDPDVLQKAMLHHKNSGSLATLLVMEHPHVGSQFGGAWADEKNRVHGFGKNSFSGCKGWHFVGALILSERVFQYIPGEGHSNILYDALTVAISKGETVQIFPFECDWFETGNPADFLKASVDCFYFLSSSKPSFQKDFLNNTLRKFSKELIQISDNKKYQLIKAESAIIEDSVAMEGLIIVGSKSCIKGPTHLKNVIVGSQVLIPQNSNKVDTIVLDN